MIILFKNYNFDNIYITYILELYVVQVFLCIFPQRHNPGVIMVPGGNFNPMNPPKRIKDKKTFKTIIFFPYINLYRWKNHIWNMYFNSSQKKKRKKKKKMKKNNKKIK